MSDLPTSVSGKTAEEVARLCAREAGRIIMSRFGRRQEKRAKGRGNFVTETDLEAEHAVLDILRREYPRHGVLSEETAPKKPEDVTEEWLWVVDPLDGTHNFSQGIPNFAFNIALCERGDPVLGLTYAPAVGDEFFAGPGCGLTVNGEPAKGSNPASLKHSVLGVDMGYDDGRAARLIALLADLWPGMQSVRVMGSAALGLAYAACGRYDVFVHQFLYPWDIAAGIALVRGGGGVIVNRDGGPVSISSEGVVAGAAGAVQDFLRLAGGRAWR
jgi:fructose-1,6-bisphosphatase/inositol monophosphatase family enzyme